MKKTIALAALLLAPIAAGAASVKTDFVAEIKAQCAQQWPGDYRMQAHCIDRQSGAALKVIKTYWAAKEGSIQRQIISKCLGDWRKEPIAADQSYDFRMAQWCADRQMASYKRIHG